MSLRDVRGSSVGSGLEVRSSLIRDGVQLGSNSSVSGLDGGGSGLEGRGGEGERSARFNCEVDGKEKGRAPTA